jgi:hypothetical protein
MKYRVRISFASLTISASEGEIIDLPEGSEYAVFCDPIEEPGATEAPAPKPKPKKAK